MEYNYFGKIRMRYNFLVYYFVKLTDAYWFALKLYADWIEFNF